MPEKIGRGPLAATLEEVADGVWLLRGDVKRGMNIYFVRDGDGVVQFDAGTQPMTSAARKAAQQLGGLKRIVLGHADSDHRGSAPHLGAPVFCHPGEREAAEAKGPYRDYWDLSRLILRARLVYPGPAPPLGRRPSARCRLLARRRRCRGLHGARVPRPCAGDDRPLAGE